MWKLCFYKKVVKSCLSDIVLTTFRGVFFSILGAGHELFEMSYCQILCVSAYNLSIPFIVAHELVIPQCPSFHRQRSVPSSVRWKQKPSQLIRTSSSCILCFCVYLLKGKLPICPLTYLVFRAKLLLFKKNRKQNTVKTRMFNID